MQIWDMTVGELLTSAALGALAIALILGGIAGVGWMRGRFGARSVDWLAAAIFVGIAVLAFLAR